MTSAMAFPAETADEARARLLILSLAGELWMLPLAARHLPALPALRDLCPGVSDGLHASEDELTELGRAFDIHLRIPGPAALLPFETSHMPDAERVRGPERLAEVAGLYRRAGYDMEPFTHLPADHLGHELRFLGALAGQRADAVARGDEAAAANLATWERGFRAEHVENWVGLFARRADRPGVHRFYRVLARVCTALASLEEIAPS